ncbi:MAG: hydantoinase/oxoprolinase family protein [Acidimicrobiales bacterium]|nr:hydantoinase/oxoprolinase family protein [Acidimicrobiales bacterium]
MSQFRIGVDIGGTFTDCAIVDGDGTVTVGKAPTTPTDPSIGFFNSITVAAEKLGLDLRSALGRTDRLAHGTTVGTNAIVARQGAKVGLITTMGHGDTLRIMDNGGRSNGVSIEKILHYPSSDLPEPFVARAMVREVPERVDADGDVVVALSDEAIREAVEQLVAQGAEAFAVCYLWSFMNNAHELRTRELIEELAPGTSVSLSHEIAPKVGEYPRMATTVLSAYIAPLMERYVATIEERAAANGYLGPVFFMQGNGGLATGEMVGRMPISTVQSGPVAGVIGSADMAAALQAEGVITTDMGGTTLDVSVIANGRPLAREDTIVEQHTLFLDLIDVRSVGAGGGSVAWIDESSGVLRVGPRSAGAVPGPVCYGNGGEEVTVTDADLVLGFIDPERFLGGRMRLRDDLARAAVAKLGDRLGMSVEECAAGINKVIDSKMGDLIRTMTVQRGLDPRKFSLYAFGGGGGLHGAMYAKDLGLQEVVVPSAETAAVWSALGVAVGDFSQTFHRPVYMTEPFDVASLQRTIEVLEAQAERYKAEIEAHVESVTFTRSASCKYGMQVYEVGAQLGDGTLDDEAVRAMIASFEANYARQFGADAGYREAGVVLTGLSVTVEGKVATVPRSSDGAESSAPAGDAERPSRPVYWMEFGSFAETPVWNGELLTPGNELTGPSIVEYPDTTVLVRPNWHLRVDAFGNLRLKGHAHDPQPIDADARTASALAL